MRLDRLRVVVAMTLWSLSGSAMAAPPSLETSPLAQIRTLDARVATIGHRLAVASLDLCRDRQWLPGLAVHDLSQYGEAERPAAARQFGLGSGPAVLAVAAGGPAQRAGLRPDDVLTAADDEALHTSARGRDSSFAEVERILDALDRAFADGAAVLQVRRDGEMRRLSVRADQGCASRFQLIPSRRLNALANGRYVQVTSAIADYVANDDELAVVLAHEFAHNILRHRARLDEAGVARGLLGRFGGNARRIRETEIEADRLSIHLLDRGGYDPRAAVRFWQRFGRRGLGALNFLGSTTHPNWRSRIALFEGEIDEIARARAEGRPGRLPFPSPAPSSQVDRNQRASPSSPIAVSRPLE